MTACAHAPARSRRPSALPGPSRPVSLPDARARDDAEICAARTQAMFRSVNETVERLGSERPGRRFGALFAAHTVVCECADFGCVDRVEITREEYAAARRSPRRFVVLPGHARAGTERVVAGSDRYVVVEKLRAGAAVAEALWDATAAA